MEVEQFSVEPWLLAFPVVLLVAGVLFARKPARKHRVAGGIILVLAVILLLTLPWMHMTITVPLPARQ